MKDFRKYLNEEFSKRQKINPRFSLRAFATKLDISPSSLSTMLNGKRAISGKNINKIGLRLGLLPAEIQKFKKEKGDDLIYVDIDLQQRVSLFSNWCNVVVHRLFMLKNFIPNLDWMTKKANISKAQASKALETLIEIGWVEKGEDDLWRLNKNNSKKNAKKLFTQIDPIKEPDSYQIDKNIARQYNQQLFKKMINEPSNIEFTNSITFALNKENLHLYKREMEKVRRKFTKIEKSSDKTDVYTMIQIIHRQTNQD